MLPCRDPESKPVPNPFGVQGDARGVFLMHSMRYNNNYRIIKDYNSNNEQTNWFLFYHLDGTSNSLWNGNSIVKKPGEQGGNANKILILTAKTNKKHQTIYGFGASDAWSIQFVGKNWPLKKGNGLQIYFLVLI